MVRLYCRCIIILQYTVLQKNNIIVNVVFKEIQFDNVFNFKTKTRLDNNRYNYKLCKLLTKLINLMRCPLDVTSVMKVVLPYIVYKGRILR